MKAIMITFDSLNRRFLEPYGHCEAITPNFSRLAEKTVRFDNCYVGSLPCIPARRELHTGRYNLLHRSWGPLEPFDDSMPAILRQNGIYSKLISDHDHYWENGGATYHTQYSGWDAIRGHEGDPWQPPLGDLEDDVPNFVTFEGMRGKFYRQHLANRAAIHGKKDFSLVKTFDAGVDFLEKYAKEDSWFLHIESFSPHEPFMASDDFKQMYPQADDGRRYEWPDYAPVTQTPKEIAQARYAYFASLSMCDEQLGRVLDLMDHLGLWEDTLLIVNTDHGYMLGEHGYWAKNYMPSYDEISHIPLFIWDPRQKECCGTNCSALVQTIDLPVTVLDFFGFAKTSDTQGESLLPVIRDGKRVHESVLFGMFGGQLCCTDGKYVYMRAPRNIDGPLYEYTLMPTHMTDFFTHEELRTMKAHPGFSFTKGLPVMQIETDPASRCIDGRDYLFDMQNDPAQQHPLNDPDAEKYMTAQLCRLLKDSDAPEEIYQRFALDTSCILD